MANPMVPAPSRSLTALFDLTNRCNLRCRMCYFSFDSVFYRREALLAPEDFERIAAQVLPSAHTVYLSAGSEPLLSPHFSEILKIARRHSPLHIKALTNGLLLTPQLDEDMIEFELNELHVSVDGARPETYEYIRRGGHFDRLVRNLERLTARKRSLGSSWPILQLNVTLMRMNLEELEEFVPLAQQLGVQRIACRHLMPYVGLDLEAETTDREPLDANMRFARFLDRAQAEGIEVTSFPDFFQVDGASWLPDVDATVDRSDLDPLIGRIEGLAPSGDSIRPFRGVVQLTGWALAVHGVEEVTLERLTEDGWKQQGRAVIHNGTRPDVQLAHRRYPYAWRGGWTYELPEGDVATADRADFRLRAVVRDRRGATCVIGETRLGFSEDKSMKPFRFCRKPFETVYINSACDVFPYPDCQSIDPIGSLLEGTHFEDLWHAPRLEHLRDQINARKAPKMCLTCPDFINRNPDDPAYFKEREVELALRRPTGYLDAPLGRVDASIGSVWVSGWALSFSPIVAIEVRRNATEHDADEGIDVDGQVLVASGRPATVQRPDVQKNHSHYPAADHAGFLFELDAFALRDAAADVHLHVVARTEAGDETILGSFWRNRRRTFRHRSHEQVVTVWHAPRTHRSQRRQHLCSRHRLLSVSLDS